MTALLAVVLIGTPAAPAPLTTDKFSDMTLYAHGFAQGFAAGREEKRPVNIFT